VLATLDKLRQSAGGDGDEQLAVSRWAFKTALMIDRTNRPERRTVPDDHFRYLFEHRKPPPAATINLARYLPETGEVPFAAWMITSWASAKGRDEGIAGYKISFTVGHAIFQTYAQVHTEREGLVFESVLNPRISPSTMRSDGCGLPRPDLTSGPRRERTSPRAVSRY
jgi:hypothetical protein